MVSKFEKLGGDSFPAVSMATILQKEQLEPRPFIPTKFGPNPLNSFGATLATNKQTDRNEDREERTNI